MSNAELDEKLEMVRDFVTEGRELLDDAEPHIIAMEKDAAFTGKVDEEILNTIFRLFHSLKGTASFLELQTIISVTHEAETLLDIFRKGRAVVGPGHVDLLCRTSDFIRNILDAVEQQLSDEGFEDGAEVIISDLKETISSISGGQENCADENPPPSLDEMQLLITPEMTSRFAEEALELCEEAESALLALEKTPGDQELAGQAFRAFHSFKGNAGFFGYADLEKVSHLAETVLDEIREGGKACDPSTISTLLAVIDELRSGSRRIGGSTGPELSEKQDIVKLLNKLAQNNRQSGHQEVLAEKNDPAGPEREGLEAGEAAPGREGPEDCGRDRLKQAQPGQQQVIRVDIEKLDKLLDLVGEMVIAEAMVANTQDMEGLQMGRFEKAVLQLDKITRDIQEVAMSMRMIPLAGTFRKMVRLVRDLAHKESKRVSLEIAGEDTEVDKTIIEQISDPLVHIIRNAVDHGLEGPGERRAAAKPETGRIRIEAKHSGGEVWIIVEDDGRGLDRERILNKGVERGLVKADDRELKDEEVWRLIFEPGFSTADKISNISGRGVGMDVVRRNIEKLRGKVDIRSRPGQGTMFVIRIPLTLAIIEGMVVKVGQQRYTIPISSIRESFQPRAAQITRTPDSQEVVRIRGELLPVIRLHDLYRVRAGCRLLTDGILIVVENGEKKCCLFVDELIGQQQIVIKGLSGYLGRVRGVSGCAILGDGDISMILDIADLISSAEEMAS